MNKNKRFLRDVAAIKKNQTWGISCDIVSCKDIERAEAKILGPRGTPYENGTFTLQIDVPKEYPFLPPGVKFITPVYHPNIDSDGRICLGLLKMEPSGQWRPIITIEFVLITIQTLLANPNTEDPLMVDIAVQYKQDREAFDNAAKAHTEKYAR
ncbi:ubiquitin-conjugating enzyme E2 T-like [Arctopsyche grandis]|uniref:ubiquitin-conjugating enzyme E2 T-like n=1 Tax=Arctopsyche grandis TaxID=121162 RepID=UPI00406DA06C